MRIVDGKYYLSPQEKRLVACLMAGKTLSRAADDLEVANSTARTYYASLCRQLGLRRNRDYTIRGQLDNWAKTNPEALTQ